MPNTQELLTALPLILRALQDSPMACLVVVCLSAFALVAFAIRQRK